jgi:hypothetical protein
MKQQTAIEWLVEEINKQKAWANPQQLEPLIDYALKKEKEQIKNVFEHCWNHAKWNGEYDIKDMEDYLKNYKQNNK